MKTLNSVSMMILSVFLLSACTLWEPLNPPPAPTASPYVYTPLPSVPAQLIVPPTATPVPAQDLVPPTQPPSPLPPLMPVPPVASATCIWGSWVADSASLSNYMSQILTASPARVASGNLRINFGADGSFHQQIENMIMTVDLGSGGGTMSMEANGSIRGRYLGSPDNTVTFSGFTESRFDIGNITVNGISVNQSPMNIDTMFINQDSRVNYQCTATTLTMSFELPTPTFAGRTFTLILTKVS